MSRLPLSPVLLLAVACSSAPQKGPATPAPADATTAEPAAPPWHQPLDDRVAARVIRLYVDDSEVRARAARELGGMGAAGAGALPDLVICAATVPREAGSRDSELDPGHLGDAAPTAECAAAIAAIGAEDPDALVAAMAVPLDVKQRALAALAEVGQPAVAGAAAVYLDACERAEGATDAVVNRHLTTTADAALAVLATDPPAAVEALGDVGHCASTGADRVRSIARSAGSR